MISLRIDGYLHGSAVFQDCLEGLKKIPDVSFDLLITDPPWETGPEAGFRTKRGEPRKGTPLITYENHGTEWHLQWIAEARRIARIVMFIVPVKEENEWTRLTDPDGKSIVYFRNGFRPSKTSKINSYSPFFVFFTERPRNKPLSNVLEYVMEWGFVPHEKYDNPSPKSEKVWKYFIEGFGARSVIDPFLGSGVTVETCEELGIPWLGFEIDASNATDIEKRAGIGAAVLAAKRRRRKKAW